MNLIYASPPVPSFQNKDQAHSHSFVSMEHLRQQELLHSKLRGMTKQLLDTSSDELEEYYLKWGVFRHFLASNIERLREQIAVRFFEDYIPSTLVYINAQFW